MAPEIHNPQAFGIDGIRRTKASDVYSFACVALEVLIYSVRRFTTLIHVYPLLDSYYEVSILDHIRRYPCYNQSDE